MKVKLILVQLLKCLAYNIEDENEYTDYDPTWDDAFFEKYGGEPWIDDNPWDHEKK